MTNGASNDVMWLLTTTGIFAYCSGSTVVFSGFILLTLKGCCTCLLFVTYAQCPCPFSPVFFPVSEFSHVRDKFVHRVGVTATSLSRCYVLLQIRRATIQRKYWKGVRAERMAQVPLQESDIYRVLRFQTEGYDQPKQNSAVDRHSGKDLITARITLLWTPSGSSFRLELMAKWIVGLTRPSCFLQLYCPRIVFNVPSSSPGSDFRVCWSLFCSLVL